jgi:hypothetical protein
LLKKFGFFLKGTRNQLNFIDNQEENWGGKPGKEKMRRGEKEKAGEKEKSAGNWLISRLVH